jgi:tetratricopeptide (TPR) repeat protein
MSLFSLRAGRELVGGTLESAPRSRAANDENDRSAITRSEIMEPTAGSARPCRRVGVACLAILVMAALAQTALAEPVRVDVLPSERKVYPEVEEGKKKLLRLDVEGARLSFEAAAKAHPELPPGRAILGSVLVTSGRVREGRVQLEKAVIEAPEDPEPYLLFGDLAFTEGRFTDCRLLYEKALALAQAFKGNETRKADYVKRALTGAALGAEKHELWEEAQKYLLALVKIDPQMGVARFRLGRVHFELKNPRDAFASLSAAARLDEKIPNPEVTMGKFCYGAKEREEADEWMQKAITGAPKDPKIRLEVGQFFLETGRINQAKAQADEAVKLDPESQDALFLAGVTNRFSKDYRKAVGYLEKAYLKAPGNLSFSNQLALAQVEMGEEQRLRALALSESAMKQNPSNAEIASTLGWIYFNVGRLDEAERMLRAAVSSPNLQPDTAYFYAKLQDARNRGDTVRPLLDAALKSELPFAYREEAQKLADQFGKRPVSAASSDTPPSKSPTTTPASKTGPAEPSKAPPSKTTPKQDPAKSEGSKSDAGKSAPPTKAPPAKAPAPKQ